MLLPEVVCIKYVFALDPWAIRLSIPFTGLALFFLPRPSIFSLGLVLDWITLRNARGLASVLRRCAAAGLLHLELNLGRYSYGGTPRVGYKIELSEQLEMIATCSEGT